MAEWVEFTDRQPSRSGKTLVWIVRAKLDGAVLGGIQWFGRWRKYAFAPHALSFFEAQCLRDIADFCEQQTKAHRKGCSGD